MARQRLEQDVPVYGDPDPTMGTAFLFPNNYSRLRKPAIVEDNIWTWERREANTREMWLAVAAVIVFVLMSSWVDWSQI